MNIEFRHIRYFRVVAEEKSFRRASGILQIAQPALSRSIKQLETILGTRLLDRSKHHVALTLAGNVFLKKSIMFTEHIEDMKKSVLLAGSGKIGHLKIGYSDFSMSGRIPYIIRKFKSLFPGIHLEILNFHSAQQAQMPKDKRLDVGFMTILPEIAEFSYFVIQEDELNAVLPVDHPFAKLERTLRLSSLSREPFIIGSQKYWSHYNMLLNHLCLSAGFVPNVEQEAGSIEGIIGLISVGMGVTILPSSLSCYASPRISMRKIDHLHKLNTALAWNKSNIDPIQKTFVDHILNSYGEDMSI